MQSLKTSLVFSCSFFLRLWLTPKLDFGADQRAIYEMGRKFYETGIIPAEGPKLVYTGESIPGGFQAVMAGLPLFFSHGEPIGLQIWVGVLNWAAMLLLFFWLRPRIKVEHETLLACFLAFSPWSLLFAPAWNPSFLPILAVPFFWILERAVNADSFSRKSWESYALGLISIFCLQLHLSAVLLALAVLVALPSIQNRWKFIGGAAGGVLTGSVFLIPWIMGKMNGTSSVPTGVVGIHFENTSDIPKAFFRYLSFPTAEISRFITPQGHGFQGMLDLVKELPWVWLPILISLAGSGVLVFWFLKRWISLRVQLTGFARVEFLVPILMTFTFLFSIKSASAHTFWILMPLSFYSMVSALSEKTMNWTAWVYLGSGLIFTVFFFIFF